MAELNRKRELNAAAELKRAEIILARRYTHQAMLAKFLRTAAQPQLLWTPAKHCADTILLEEQRQLELAVWMVSSCDVKSRVAPTHDICEGGARETGVEVAVCDVQGQCEALSWPMACGSRVCLRV